MKSNIVITGASSGIGRALALEYSAAGSTIGLVGRDAARLDKVVAECRAAGADTRTGIVDVRNRNELATWIEEFDKASPVDLVVANAGVLVRMAKGDIEPADGAYALIETNVLGVLNTVQPIIPRMKERGRGQIAIIASVAAFTPLPHAPSYSASKAAVLNYGLSLRALLAPHGIRVNVVCSGYIETPMIADIDVPKPFNMAADKGARLIRRGLEKDRAVVAFPLIFAAMSRIDGLLPDKLRRWVNGQPTRVAGGGVR